MTLWLVLGLMTLVAIAFVGFPLWRNSSESRVAALELRKQKNREVFALRQQELEQEVQSGLVSAADSQEMQVELQRAFMRDMEALAETGASHRSALGRTLPLALLLVMPIFSYWLYLDQGASQDLPIPGIIDDIQQAPDEGAQLAALNNLADSLLARFERRPEDVESAYMLGTLLMELERYQEAVATFEALLLQLEVGPDRATVLGQIAQIRFVQADSTITPDVQSVMDQALALNPNEPTVMDIQAINAILQEDFASALLYWRRELSTLTPGSQKAQTLLQRIAALETYMTDDERAAVAQSRIEIRLEIALAPELASRVTNDMRLYLFINNPAGGPPLLAQNLPLPEFPFSYVMDESMVMLAGRTIDPTQPVIAGARLSPGQANREPGDLDTESEPFTVEALGDGVLALTIDTVAPDN